MIQFQIQWLRPRNPTATRHFISLAGVFFAAPTGDSSSMVPILHCPKRKLSCSKEFSVAKSTNFKLVHFSPHFDWCRFERWCGQQVLQRSSKFYICKSMLYELRRASRAHAHAHAFSIRKLSVVFNKYCCNHFFFCIVEQFIIFSILKIHSFVCKVESIIFTYKSFLNKRNENEKKEQCRCTVEFIHQIHRYCHCRRCRRRHFCHRTLHRLEVVAHLHRIT